MSARHVMTLVVEFMKLKRKVRLLGLCIAYNFPHPPGAINEGPCGDRSKAMRTDVPRAKEAWANAAVRNSETTPRNITLPSSNETATLVTGPLHSTRANNIQ